MSVTWLAGAVETACNSALALDTEVRAQLGELADKVIAIDILGLDLPLYFFPSAQGVQVLSHYEGDPDTWLRGAPLSLLRLTLSDKPADELFAGGIELRGDTHTGQRFQEILQRLDLDWEELLARFTGDAIAHQVGRAARGAQTQGTQARHTLEKNLNEYLHEEAGLLVNHAELDAFLHDVDTIRSDSERLDARLRRLEAALHTNKD